MGLFETIAVADLKLRLILGAAGLAFALVTVAGMALFGPDRGLFVGAGVGTLLAIAAGMAVYRKLP